ncbi:methyl-accepting chemotaxis protein [Rhizobium sp. SJZ105]|uniref:methyl-accepting chemotaxis protein n=1 Tax=Rhizobium sp. SJZ105 TaxID=2572678 RepID=UPI00119F72E2|nr:methyl-accepting chemotaxis protein [Rhizobium sp. SJZ105]TWC77269.1 methyl-accepting chemotaxis protein [Rhizobium sp. SJZ105]
MNFFNNLRILPKIAVALTIIIVIALAVTIMGARSLSKQQQTGGMTEHTYQVIGSLNNVVLAMTGQESGLRGYLLTQTDRFIASQNAAAAAYQANLAQVRSLTSDNPAQQKRLDELDAFVKGWIENVQKPRMTLMSNPATADKAMEHVRSSAGKEYMEGVQSKAKDMIEVEQTLLVQRTALAQAAVETSRMVSLIGGISLLVVAGFSLLLLHRALVRPLIGINGAMSELASGKTDLEVPGNGRKDEVGEMASAVEVFRQAALSKIELEREANAQRDMTEEERRRRADAERLKAEEMAQATAGLGEGLKHLASGDLTFQLSDPFAADFEVLRADFNAAVGQLSETLRAVSDATNGIDTGSREVSASADDLSKRTERQAASLEETAAALDQITVNVANSSKRADEARKVAVLANESAAQSGKVVADAVDAMQKIEQSSDEISNIIGVIDEIAFQTNLLALNAGVEAARAGDAGKGFAVVAQEVRELAQRSAKAAKEIKDLIRNSSVEVQSGVKLVSDTGAALKTIESYIVTVNQHMDSIATSAKEQSVGLAEVNTAVNQMDQVTQQNAAMVEETSAAGAALANESGKLRELISQFQLGGALRHTASIMAAGPAHRPVVSPVRKLAGKVAKAFSGNAAVKETWEDF